MDNVGVSLSEIVSLCACCLSIIENIYIYNCSNFKVLNGKKSISKLYAAVYYFVKLCFILKSAGGLLIGLRPIEKVKVVLLAPRHSAHG